MRAATMWVAVLLVGFGLVRVDSTEVHATTTSTSMNATQARRQITVPAGTRILVRTIDTLDSSKQKSGTRFTATLETDLRANDRTVAKRGTTVYGQLVSAKSAGRFKGSSQLTLELTDILLQGTAHPLVTTTFELKGSGEGKKTTRKVLGGAGLGAIIGGIAGGGSGAAIGVVTGGAVGTGIAGSKKGEQLMIPSESLLEFRLEEPASLPAPR